MISHSGRIGPFKGSAAQSLRGLEREGDAVHTSLVFTILSQAVIFSMPHRDHHGKVTVITALEGEKLWPICVDEYFSSGIKLRR
ncbi:hypothetical protein PGQ11_006844 [Apiospora arundinis]|uniref:Uncharacterized protein n=1 Tax=Apiospora arundinis TaxID=335852 RepID=A0ABR2IU00_9PEZI